MKQSNDEETETNKKAADWLINSQTLSKSVLIFPAILRNFNVGCVVAKRRIVNNPRCVSLRHNTPYS
ncbi:hypothetical protein [Nostoc sp.]|uniref:hypothetical protein n=1 Tax=Nostoc sp. TaxID=1180 RepID=UPI002FF639E3